MGYPGISSLDAALQAARVSHGVVTYPRGGTFGPRLQQSVQLVFVHDGSARVSVGSDEIVIGSGFGALLLPHNVEYFQFSHATETTHSWVHYWSAPEDEPLLARLEGVQQVCRVSPGLARLVQGLIAQALPSGARAALRAYEILYAYVDAAGAATDQPVALERALTFVEQHLSEPLDVDRLAAAALVSKSHLFRLFRGHLGVSPADYVWQRRVDLAVELLRETGLPVAAVAERAGFATPKHLARRVRAATGLPPTQLRSAALGVPTPPAAS